MAANFQSSLHHMGAARCTLAAHHSGAHRRLTDRAYVCCADNAFYWQVRTCTPLHEVPFDADATWQRRPLHCNICVMDASSFLRPHPPDYSLLWCSALHSRWQWARRLSQHPPLWAPLRVPCLRPHHQPAAAQARSDPRRCVGSGSHATPSCRMATAVSACHLLAACI